MTLFFYKYHIYYILIFLVNPVMHYIILQKLEAATVIGHLTYSLINIHLA